MSDFGDDGAQTTACFLQHDMAPHIRRREAEASLPINERGLCIECDEPIEPGRLRFNPRAVRCVDCQTDYEARS